MEETIFTKIINGDIPSAKMYEDELTYAFLDINPTQPGHTLVIPKRPIEFLWDLPDEDYQAVMNTVKKLSVHLRDKLNVPYVGAKVIGVDVPHAHVHLIPFTSSDQYVAQSPLSPLPSAEELQALAKTLAL